MAKNFNIKDKTEEFWAIAQGLENMGATNVKIYEMGECRIIHAIEHGRHHLTISTTYRLPTWHEVKTARYKLMPNDINIVMVLPPPENYVNIHNYCFQLWETQDPQIGNL